MSRPALSDGFWASVLQWSRVGVNAIVFLFAARYLTLSEIGAFATAVAPLRFFQVIPKSGIEDSVVIQQQRPNDPQLDALFMVAVICAVLMTGLTLGIAFGMRYLVPHDAGIGGMMAALSLVNLSYGIAAVPDGILRRAHRFRVLALRTLASQAVAAILTVMALLAGLGAWSLVVFTLANAALGTVISAVMANWQPSRHWPERTAFRTAWKSTVGISGRVLVGAAVQPLLQIAIGSVSGLAAAGIFQIAVRVLALLDAIAFAPLRFLALPRFSRLQDDPDALGTAILKALGIAGLVSAYVYLGAFAAAPDLLALMVGGENGTATVGVLRVLCLGGLAGAVFAVLNQAFIGTGKAGVAFRLAILQAVLTTGFAMPRLSGPIFGVAIAVTFAALVMTGVMLVQMQRCFGVRIGRALWTVGAPYVAGAFMALGVVALDLRLADDMPLFLRLFLQILAGTVLYLLAVRIVAPNTLATLWSRPTR